MIEIQGVFKLRDREEKNKRYEENIEPEKLTSKIAFFEFLMFLEDIILFYLVYRASIKLESPILWYIFAFIILFHEIIRFYRWKKDRQRVIYYRERRERNVSKREAFGGEDFLDAEYEIEDDTEDDTEDSTDKKGAASKDVFIDGKMTKVYTYSTKTKSEEERDD